MSGAVVGASLAYWNCPEERGVESQPYRSAASLSVTQRSVRPDLFLLIRKGLGLRNASWPAHNPEEQ